MHLQLASEVTERFFAGRRGLAEVGAETYLFE
jgi:hypothetical protein